MAAGILLVIYLPVFIGIVGKGNAVDYNALHKITTLYSNPKLFLYAVGIMLLYFVLYRCLSFIKYNKYTVTAAVIFSACLCLAFFAGKIYISKCIAFYGGWDCGMVANSARWVYNGEGIGYDDYYYIYHNNIPITWLLYKLYYLANNISYPYNPEFIWIQYQCLIFAVSLFLISILLLALKKKIAPAIMSVLCGGIFLGLSPWQIIPYTDGTTLAFPLLVICLYVLYRRINHPVGFFVWFLIIFAGMIGGIMKATCYVSLFSVLITELIGILTDHTDMLQKGKKAFLSLFFCFLGITAAIMCRNQMYRKLDYVPIPEWQMTWSNYMYIGLEDEMTGACSGKGLELVRAYKDSNPGEREAQERLLVRQEIAEKGFRGLLDFCFRKEVMNFNDGTFSWYQEGFFQAWDYPQFTEMEKSVLQQKLRDFYWMGGDRYVDFVTASQILWLFVQLGILLETILILGSSVANIKSNTPPEDEILFKILLLLIFIGVYLFVCLFEGRARYLINSLPFFCAVSVLGYSDFLDTCVDAWKQFK